MIKESELRDIIDLQREIIIKEDSFQRNLLSNISVQTPDFVTIISGVRRCGKSTLLGQLIKQQNEDTLFINFDNARLYSFDVQDFKILDSILQSSGARILFFDEIQIIKGWEVYVRGKLDEGYKIIVTGSNASMLSRELGTRLTGRHISKELFPFSFSEFCGFKKMVFNDRALKEYLSIGGFPQYVKYKNQDILNSLLEDILYRDIVVRYNIRDVISLRNLLVYLLANIGNLVSATKLTQVVGVKTSKTILEYFSFFEQSYLVQFMSKFSYSYKVQIVNPRKVYCIDCGLHSVVTPSLSQDNGRKLENIVFMELRRKSVQVYYYNEHGKECDFVVCKNNQPINLIQVCFELTNDNESREINGLVDAMKTLHLNNGVILTFNQEDLIQTTEGTIQVTPVWKWLQN